MLAGKAASLAAGRTGRGTSSPEQLGQIPVSLVVAQVWQNVHSNEQMRASLDSGGRSALQHSQLGRSWSMDIGVGGEKDDQFSHHGHFSQGGGRGSIAT